MLVDVRTLLVSSPRQYSSILTRRTSVSSDSPDALLYCSKHHLHHGQLSVFVKSNFSGGCRRMFTISCRSHLRHHVGLRTSAHWPTIDHPTVCTHLYIQVHVYNSTQEVRHTYVQSMTTVLLHPVNVQYSSKTKHIHGT